MIRLRESANDGWMVYAVEAIDDIESERLLGRIIEGPAGMFKPLIALTGPQPYMARVFVEVGFAVPGGKEQAAKDLVYMLQRMPAPPAEKCLPSCDGAPPHCKAEKYDARSAPGSYAVGASPCEMTPKQ
jgi:hypothetical protein